MSITIGITFSEVSYSHYPEWIQGEDPTLEVIAITVQNQQELNRCHGLVLSGGIDTHPRFYNSSILDYPGAPLQFDEARDAFELEMFWFACEMGIPLLAICRGMQLVNIALGGDMVQDLETSGKANHRKNGNTDGIHTVSLVSNSLLHSLAGAENGIVNSAHHQGLGKLAPALQITAWSPDGVPEAMEWEDKAGPNFFLGVQWHPERLDKITPGNPLGNGIRSRFMDEIRKSK